MKTLFLAKSMDDPATRYRLKPLLVRLNEAGEDFVVFYEPGLLDRMRVLWCARSAGTVFIQRKLFGRLFLTLLGLVSRRVIFDFDDAIFLRSNGKVSRTRRARFRATCRISSLVLAGNEYLSREAARWVRTAEVLVQPTCVPTERYSTAGQKDPVFTLVWIGSRSTSRYLEQYRPVLEAIGRRFPDIRLKVIGDFKFQLDAMKVVLAPWSEATEAQALASAHVGIAPMSEDPWTRGKCALKVIQYMAAGLPVISSRAGANAGHP